MTGDRPDAAPATAAPSVSAREGGQPAGPRYADGTLADVLPGVLTAFGGSDLARRLDLGGRTGARPGEGTDRLGLAGLLDGRRRVAVLLIDGMGWQQVPEMAAYAPRLAAALASGRLMARRITSGFPSTTPTSLVSLGTGTAPGAHGVLGFTLRIPGTDRLLNHVLWRDEPPPDRWVPVPPLLPAAAAAGVSVAVVNRPEFAGSGLTEASTGGIGYRPTLGAAEVAAETLTALRELAGPALVYGYLPDLDKAGHLHGLGSQAWRDAAAAVDLLVGEVLDGLPGDAALIVTADHGQLDVPADRRIDLGRDRDLTTGLHLVAGEPRVRYLHPRPGAAADLLAAWRARVGHAAWIGTREEAVASGWYGPVTARFAGRLGDIVVVCRDDWAIQATGFEDPRIADLVAMHGALTPTELEIPLLVGA